MSRLQEDSPGWGPECHSAHPVDHGGHLKLREEEDNQQGCKVHTPAADNRLDDRSRQSVVGETNWSQGNIPGSEELEDKWR